MSILKGTRLERALKRFSPRYRRLLGPSPETNFILCVIWLISGLVAVLVPLIYRTIHKRKHEQVYMSYFWEKEMEYYEEQRYEAYQKYGNNYNYGGAYMYPENWMEREYIDVNNCKWWQLNCFSYYVNQDGEPAAQQGWYPTWYSGWATTEEEQEEREKNREQPGSLKFVYIWQIVLFTVIIGYGFAVVRENRNPTGLIIALLVWANFCFMSMWLMADGSIATDGDEVLRSGFYGQMSVLIFMANFWYFLHGVVFVIVFWIRLAMMNEEERRNNEIARKVAEQQAAHEAVSEQPEPTRGYVAPENQPQEKVLPSLT
jgi:uncharacterized membrane protein